MKIKPYSPFFWLLALILAVSLACGPSPAPTEAPQPQVTQEQQPQQPAASPTPEPTQPPSGLVQSLQEIKKATIQIEAQGTFVDPEVGVMYNSAGRGSGFIIDPSGIAVTNNHVVTGAALIKVWVGGDTSKSYNARVLGVSECSDLAVIDIDGDGYPYYEWYSGTANVGLEVYAAGYPLGDPEFTLTKGIVSKEKTSGETSWASVDSVIEHDATINPGNSGGPLVDPSGKVVGINYAGSSSTNQYFAIGRQVALSVIDQLRQDKDVDSIGINGQAVSSDDGSLTGIWVASIQSGSPADKAGVKPGDIITTIENLILATDGSMSEYCDILRTHQPTDALSIQVLRWDTQEILEGQLNGRALSVAASFANQLSEQTNDTGAATGEYAEYVSVTDDTNSITLDVPAEWTDIDTRIWSETWGDLAFEAPSISASANLDNYYNTFSESGVFFAASPRFGEIGGYIELLDGVRGWYENDCTLEGRYDYGEGEWEDPLYEGKFDLWENCGPDDTIVLVLAARPKDNPSAYLLLLETKITKDADLTALDFILQSFQASF
jgi:serine protease Do